MDVILLERVEKLGQMGQVVKVRPGFARNYLLPQKKALRATKENLAVFEKQRAHLEAANLKAREEATYVAGKMKGVAVTVIRQAGETGILYGSVSARDVADGLITQGYKVDRQQVSIERPIKTLGLFDVRIVLHPEVIVGVKVNVARSLEEARLQGERGGMVTAADMVAQEDEAEAQADEAEAAAA